jgi:hypothetical protein
MALSNMKVFNRELQTATIETLVQMVDKFNAASGGAIVLTSDGFEGDYRHEAFWQGVHSAQRRVDRGLEQGLDVADVVDVVMADEDPADVLRVHEAEDVREVLLAVLRHAGVDDHRLLGADDE